MFRENLFNLMRRFSMAHLPPLRFNSENDRFAVVSPLQKVKIYCVISGLALIPSAQQLRADPTLADVSARARTSTVYISIQFLDPKTNEIKTDVGSGVIISPDGDILTDFHVIGEWLSSTDESKKDHPLLVHIGSKFSEGRPTNVVLVDDKADVALLRIRESHQYPFAPICYNTPLRQGMYIFAFGYPNDQELSAVPGTYNNAGAEDNRWRASMNMSRGMSGGPIYDEKGFVIGLVNSGISDGTTSMITPIRWVRSMIENRTDARPACFRSCRSAEHGVESWGLTSPWSATTGWLVGGRNAAEVCAEMRDTYLRAHPQELLEIDQSSQDTQKDFLGNDTVQYHCAGIVKLDPVYWEKNSQACGLAD
jgi:Trypsin-like peptidase domain